MKGRVDRHHIAPACGGCGSLRLLVTTSDGCTYGICEDCQRLQEVETRADPHRHLCDNCAFRPGSPERADPDRWFHIEQNAVEGPQTFYCHKGMAAELTDGTMRNLPGETVATLQPCAGWRAARKAYLAQQMTDV